MVASDLVLQAHDCAKPVGIIRFPNTPQRPDEAQRFSGVTSRLQAAARESTAADIPAAGAQNLRSIQHLIDAIGRNDLDEAIANAHDDVRFEIYAPLEFQWIRQAIGIKELKAALRHNFGSLAEQHPEITTLTAQGDTVVLIGREHGRVKATGEPYRMQFVSGFSSATDGWPRLPLSPLTTRQSIN